jgi:hypothetical protein
MPLNEIVPPDQGPKRATQWHGETDVTIAFGTDPWLRDKDGNDVDLEQLLADRTAAANNRCSACHGSFLAGVLAPNNSAYGVESCDWCRVRDGDLDAARALAAALDTDFTVWFERKSA